MNTKRNLHLIAAFIAATVILHPLAASGRSDTSQSRIIQGTVSYLEGDVYINGKSAEIGDRVGNRDTLETGKGSFCEVIFEDANVFRLDESTVTKIDWAKSDIELEKGGISAVFNKLDKLLKEMREFTVSTTAAVAGVRGTVFYARVESKNTTYVCICNGTLAMEYDKTEKDISATHHKAYRFTLQNGKTTWTDAPMLYHDDALMDSVASQINYTIPWGREKAY